MISDVENVFVDIFFSFIILKGINSHFRSNAYNSGRFTCLFFFAPKRERSNEEVSFSMAIRNEELMHACFPKHSRMGTETMKEDKKTDEKCYA